MTWLEKALHGKICNLVLYQMTCVCKISVQGDFSVNSDSIRFFASGCYYYSEWIPKLPLNSTKHAHQDFFFFPLPVMPKTFAMQPALKAVAL